MEPAISIRELTKSYGNVRALDTEKSWIRSFSDATVDALYAGQGADNGGAVPVDAPT